MSNAVRLLEIAVKAILRAQAEFLCEKCPVVLKVGICPCELYDQCQKFATIKTDIDGIKTAIEDEAERAYDQHEEIRRRKAMGA